MPTSPTRGFKAKQQEIETAFLFSFWRVKVSTKLKITMGFLIAALFAERFFFMIIIYRAKFYGYVLILIVILFNCVFNFCNQQMRKHKHKRRLHELFNIDRTPRVGLCMIGFIGLLDTFYAFFRFWPANVMPVWLLIILLQLFIPLNTLLRSSCVGLKHYKIHMFSSLIIIVGCAISFGDLSDPAYQLHNVSPSK